MLLVQSTLEYTQKNLTFYYYCKVRFVEFCLIFLFVCFNLNLKILLGPTVFRTHLCIPNEEKLQPYCLQLYNLLGTRHCKSQKNHKTFLGDKKSN